MEIFRCETKVIAGAGAVGSLKELKSRRLLVVADPYFGKNGWAEKIARVSGAEQWEIFDRVQPDPTVELAAEGTAKLLKFCPDTVIALGGGSAMDCAKAMVYFSGLPVQLAAVPTTSGSGSEMTDFAVLTHGGTKYPLVDSALRPQLAILDSDLLEGLPPALIADSGFDVLSHALEALAATGAGGFTDALACSAFCTVYPNLLRSFRGDKTPRLKIHIASAMAGLAFTRAGLGLCHGISHTLGGLFHVPHGRLNAILLPAVVACNAPAAGEKYAALARQAGLGGSADCVAVRNLISGLVRLRRELQLPATLGEAGISPAQLGENREKILSAVLEDPCCGTNPVKVDRHLAEKVLEQVAGHG